LDGEGGKMTDQAKNVIKDAKTEALFAAAHAAMPELVRSAQFTAAVRRIHYDASIAKGFTPSEALALCIESTRPK